MIDANNFYLILGETKQITLLGRKFSVLTGDLLYNTINHVQCYDCLKLKPSKFQSSFNRFMMLTWTEYSKSNNVFQRDDTQSCDMYVGCTSLFIL